MRGHVSYDATVGKWWEERAADEPHARAYRHAAEYTRDAVRAALARSKKKVASPLIVDFACGGGHFLLETHVDEVAGLIDSFLDRKVS